ncbi:protein WEAK CHLOROPLAST MOVEMENT UNDER BLUE LIGHT 1-like [Typha angustifolia]|uniref:protein WEAK CHLOROPLAST MOVEMENT UNDER BLUE LIGHT 1-like n=1 Tax=Typha angustifolia TaxID=59011 RepID=UPI003C2F4136
MEETKGGDLPTSPEPPISSITDEGSETNGHHRAGVVGDMQAVIQPTEPESPFESKTPIDDSLSTEVISSFDHPTMVDKSKTSQDDSAALLPEVVSNPYKLDDGTTNRVSDVQISNSPADFIAIGKAIELLNDVPIPLVETKSKMERPEKQIRIENMQKKASDSSNHLRNSKRIDPERALVELDAKFESIKASVTMFGGSVDWKAQRAKTLEKRKDHRFELEKVQKEIAAYKKKLEAAEEAKAEVLEELESTKRLIEELKFNLKRAQAEEDQAKQEAELAQNRVEEMELQLAVAKAKHETAVAEFKSAKEELVTVEEHYDALVQERDISNNKMEEAASVKEEIKKSVDELTLELTEIKESLKLANAAHLEAEELRISTSLAREQDCLTWDKEVKQAEEEVQQLNEKLLSAKDLKLKLHEASTLLLELKAELEAYMEAKLNLDAEEAKKTHQEALDSMIKELEEDKGIIERVKDEVDCLRVAASSLREELDKEKTTLITLQQRKGMAFVTLTSLQDELSKTEREIEMVREKEKEAGEKMVELPKLLQEAAQKAEQAKSAVLVAQEDLRKAKEEAEQAKAGATTTEIRLRAAIKEIEAAKFSENLALSAIHSLQESEKARSNGEQSPGLVALHFDEYFTLSKRAHEAEELLHQTVGEAFSQVELAKETESKISERINQAYKVMNEKREALRVALEKEENAKVEKLGLENELRKWRSETEQHRKSCEVAKNAVNPLRNLLMESDGDTEKKDYNEEKCDIAVHSISDQKLCMSEGSPDEPISDDPKQKKKKKSFFPRVVMLISRKKSQK